MTRIVTLAVVVAVVACGGPARVWFKAQTPREVTRRDGYECERDAAMLPRTPQSVTTLPGGLPLYSDPTLGWGDVAAREALFSRCMQARGYELLDRDVAARRRAAEYGCPDAFDVDPARGVVCR